MIVLGSSADFYPTGSGCVEKAHYQSFQWTVFSPEMHDFVTVLVEYVICISDGTCPRPIRDWSAVQSAGLATDVSIPVSTEECKLLSTLTKTFDLIFLLVLFAFGLSDRNA